MANKVQQAKGNGGKRVKTDPTMKTVSEFLQLKLGYQNYKTIGDLCHLDHYIHARRGRQSDAFQLTPGINKQLIKMEAPKRYTTRGGRKHLLVHMEDGTRGVRMYQKLAGKPFLAGYVFHPDVDKWNEDEPGHPMPTKAEDVLFLMNAIRGKDALAHSFDSKAVRSLNLASTPILVHSIIPEPHSGTSGRLQFKQWLRYIQLYFEARLSVCMFSHDGCSVQLSSASILMTPSQEMLDWGCSYIGLPVDDYKYFGLYCQPSYYDDSGELVVPMPIVDVMERAHDVRNYRKSLKNPNKTYVFYSEKNTLAGDGKGAEVGIFASMRYLTILCESRGDLSRKYALKDMVNINKFCDQKGDAAYKLISLDIINLMKRHIPEDVATILTRQAMYYRIEPVLNPLFTNPFEIVTWVWRGYRVFQRQEQYVSKLVGDLNLHTASHQFRKGAEIMTYGVTDYICAFHRGMEQHGWSWDDLGLCRANDDPIEGVHSEERCGHLVQNGADMSVDLNAHCNSITRVQQVYNRLPKLRETGWKISQPKHIDQSRDGSIKTLGLPPGTSEQTIRYGPWAEEKVPNGYDEFIQRLIHYREKGIDLGDEDFERALPKTVAQMRDPKNKCGKDIWEDLRRPKAKHPAGFAPVQGPLHDTQLPKKCMPPSEFKLDKEQSKKVSAFEEKIRQSISELGLVDRHEGYEAAEDGSEADPEAFMTPPVLKALSDARAERLDLSNRLETLRKGIKQEDRVLLGHSTEQTDAQIVSLERLLSGDVIMDGQTAIPTNQFMAVNQRREQHSRDRGDRFIVGRLLNFKHVLKDGHDAFIGAIFCVQMGQGKSFAVGRVIGMLENDAFVYSLKFAKGSKLQRYMLELLDPVGPPTDKGSQRYRGSGAQLPKGASALVLRRVELRHIHALLLGESTHDALLAIDDILDLQDKGYHRLTYSEGHLHAQNEEEEEQDYDGEIDWQANKSEHCCLMCHDSFWDDATGAIVQCITCKNHWHMDCHHPKIRFGDVDLQHWQCAVCSGLDTDICTLCHFGWTVDNKKREKDNNRLMFCEGKGCGRWWHQKCHDPYAPYPGDDMPWHCGICERRKALEKEQEDAAKGKHQPARAVKKTAKGVHAPKAMRIADPAESSLQKATWVTKGATHKGGGEPSVPKQPATNKKTPGAPKAGDAVLARFKGAGKHFYAAKVVRVNPNGTYVIDYDDGDHDSAVPSRNVKPAAP